MTVVHEPANDPQAPPESAIASRWMIPEPASMPEPESVPFEIVIVSEPVVS